MPERRVFKLSGSDGKVEAVDSGRFIIEVKFRQNETWQGTVQHEGEQETLCFRSMLELLKIMESAMAGIPGGAREF